MAADDRFRRPAAHEELLGSLVGKNGPFRSFVDALMFAAALGHRKGARVPFDKAGEPIRLALMDGRQYGDVLVDVIAAAEVEDDPEVLADERLAERIRIFEEYANGGLNFLQGEVNAKADFDLVTLITSLVMDALTTPQDDDLADLLQYADLAGDE